MSPEYQTIPLEGFVGGLNTSVDASALKPNELTEALNVRILDNGEVQRRTGYKEWSQGLSNDIHHAYLWTTPTGVDQMLAIGLDGHVHVAETGPYFVDEGQIGSVSTPGDLRNYPIGFASSEDVLYLSTLRSQNVHFWDGDQLKAVTAAYDPPPPAEGDPEDTTVYVVMPVGQHLVYRHGRMYVGHTLEDPSRVWFSHVLDPERYDEEGWIDLDPDDGTTITAMINFADELFIFKDNSIWELTGRDPTTYTLRAIDRLRGTVSPKTVCQMRGMLVFYDRDSGVWGYDGSQLTLLSEKITHVLLNGQDYGTANRASMYFGDDRLYLSIPKAGGGDVTWVMNAQNGAWSMYDTGFYAGLYRRNERIQSIVGHPGLAIADPLLETILGDPYVSRFRTGWLMPFGFGGRGRLRRVEGIAEAQDGTLLEISLYREMRGDLTHRTRVIEVKPANLPGAASTSDTVVHQFASDGWGGRLHSLQLGVRMLETPTQVNRMALFVTGRRDVRGEM